MLLWVHDGNGPWQCLSHYLCHAISFISLSSSLPFCVHTHILTHFPWNLYSQPLPAPPNSIEIHQVFLPLFEPGFGSWLLLEANARIYPNCHPWKKFPSFLWLCVCVMCVCVHVCTCSRMCDVSQTPLRICWVSHDKGSYSLGKYTFTNPLYFRFSLGDHQIHS